MTAAAVVSSTPRPLAAYLRRATWGLSAARRQELWDELEEHLLTRADHLCAFGTPYEQALAQAILEMGPPAKVSAGMSEVYLMPKLLMAAGAAALALGAAFFALAGGGALLSVPGLSFKLNIPDCKGSAIVSNSRLKNDKALERAACVALADGISQANLAYVGLNDLKQVFNDNGILAKLRPSGDLEMRYPDGRLRILPQQIQSGGQGYTRASNLIVSTIRESVTPLLQLGGYTNPVLTFGNLRLQLGTMAHPVDGALFYQDVVPTLLGILINSHPETGWSNSYSSVSGNVGALKHIINPNLKPGEVVSLVARRDQGIFNEDVAQVAQDGTVTLRSTQRHLRFVTDPALLSSKASNGRVNALLLRVTNIPLRDLKSGILRPASPTSDAR